MANLAPNTRSTNSGTATPTATQTVTETSAGPSIPIATLRLRAAQPQESRRIQWAEDVIDNEGMGKKKSKVCCIYHRPKEPGESDSDSDSSSSSGDSDSEPDLSKARRAGGGKGKSRGRGHNHDHNEAGDDARKGDEGARKASPNAYERQPRNKSKKEG